jgi:hypothetical protein
MTTTPEGLELPNEEAQKVIDELKAAGNEFPDLKEEKKPEEKLEDKTPEKTEEEIKAEEESKIKAEAEEKAKAEKELEDSKREPRQPKMIPAWKINIEKKREEQKKQDQEKSLAEELEDLKKEILTIKEGRKAPETPKEENEFDKKVKELSEKYPDVNQDFIKDIVSAFPKSEKPEFPKEYQEKISLLENLASEKKQQDEDLKFSKNFDSKIASKVKEQYPQATAEDIEAVKTEMQKHYFDEKYIKLGIEEIYTLKKSELEKQISPETVRTAETGQKGTGRGGNAVDYANVSEEEFSKMSPEEQDKVIDYRTKHSRL